MPDYRIMYLELMQATERAIQTLEEAQLRCKELYSEGIDEEKDQNEGRQKRSPDPIQWPFSATAKISRIPTS